MAKSAYVATSLLNADRAKRIRDTLKEIGYSITYDWTTHGKLTDRNELAAAGLAEAKGVHDADVIFFICPGRTGAHIELGIMIGQIMLAAELNLARPRTIIFLEDVDGIEEKTFYCLPFVNRFKTEEAALEFAKNRLT